MKQGGEITGFEQVTKPYSLRYSAAKAFNDSRELSHHIRIRNSLHPN